MHFLALGLKNQRSITGRSLLCWLPESDQGCGSKPGSHRSFIAPLSMRSTVPSTCPPSSHPQTSLCLPLCGSEGGTGMHKVIPIQMGLKEKPWREELSPPNTRRGGSGAAATALAACSLHVPSSLRVDCLFTFVEQSTVC